MIWGDPDAPDETAVDAPVDSEAGQPTVSMEQEKGVNAMYEGDEENGSSRRRSRKKGNGNDDNTDERKPDEKESRTGKTWISGYWQAR